MSKKRILIVDDEENFLKMLKLNLEKLSGYEVNALPTAKNIIDEVHSFKPDLIVLDLLMPGIGGIDACAMLNDDPIGQKTPIIIFSALDKKGDELEAYKLGVVNYIVKPVGIEELTAKIEKALKYKNNA